MKKEKDTNEIVSSFKAIVDSREFAALLNLLPESFLQGLYETCSETLISDLLEIYQKAAKEVRHDRRKGHEARREKLKKVLTPIHLINKAIALDRAFTRPGTPEGRCSPLESYLCVTY